MVGMYSSNRTVNRNYKLFSIPSGFYPVRNFVACVFILILVTTCTDTVIPGLYTLLLYDDYANINSAKILPTLKETLSKF